ncbi:hypothetical protein Tco_1538812 [Tanacetum coccineum]
MLTPRPEVIGHGEPSGRGLGLIDSAIWKILGLAVNGPLPAGLKLAEENLQLELKREDSNHRHDSPLDHKIHGVVGVVCQIGQTMGHYHHTIGLEGGSGRIFCSFSIHEITTSNSWSSKIHRSNLGLASCLASRYLRAEWSDYTMLLGSDTIWPDFSESIQYGKTAQQPKSLHTMISKASPKSDRGATRIGALVKLHLKGAKCFDGFLRRRYNAVFFFKEVGDRPGDFIEKI